MSRYVGPLALALGLASLVPALGDGPAHAAPAPDCTPAFPVVDVVDGQTVHGLTVSEGTTPDPFTGEVLGVLDDGIAPGIDSILMLLDSPALQQAGGIWSGMSGSPVYDDATGDLIGAVSHTLIWGTTPIAGVTPFEDMDDYLATPAVGRKVAVPRDAARAIAATGEATVAQAEQGLQPLAVPTGISGVRVSRLDGAADRAYIPKNAVGIGAADPSAADADTLVAGGNLAAVQSIGDVTSAGVGTVTSVCDGRLVGFGHPMSFAGDTSYGMAAADAILIQDSLLDGPFKLANIGELGGTVTDDRLTAIAGSLGPAPLAAPFTSEVTFGARTRVGHTEILVQDALPGIVFSGSLGNHDRVFDQIGEGSETQAFTIAGIDPSGEPFALEYADRVQSSYDLSYDASYPLADIVYILGRFPGVEITSITSTSDVTKVADYYTLRKVQQRRDGRWFNVTRRPARVRAGGTLRLRATLVSASGTTRVPFRIEVPRRLAGTRGGLSLSGGNENYLIEELFEADTFGDAIALIDENARNDQLDGEVRIGRGQRRFQRDFVTTPVDLVVNGWSAVAIVVR